MSLRSLKLRLGPGGKFLKLGQQMVGLGLRLQARPILDFIFLPQDTAKPGLLRRGKTVAERIPERLHRRGMVLLVGTPRVTRSQRQ